MKFGHPLIPETYNIPEEFSWGQSIARALREVVYDLVSILDRGIRFDEHMYGGSVTIRVVGGDVPVSFTPKTKEVKALWVGKVRNDSSNTSDPTSAVWCKWEYVDGKVEISDITGIVTDNIYHITFMYIGA